MLQKEILTHGGGGRQDSKALERQQPLSVFWLPLGLRKESASRCSNDEDHGGRNVLTHASAPCLFCHPDVLPAPQVMVSRLGREEGLTDSRVCHPRCYTCSLGPGSAFRANSFWLAAHLLPTPQSEHTMPLNLCEDQISLSED